MRTSGIGLHVAKYYKLDLPLKITSLFHFLINSKCKKNALKLKDIGFRCDNFILFPDRKIQENALMEMDTPLNVDL